MKEKILPAIKAKFPKVNLSKKRLDAIAAKIETKVIDDETKIDAAIDDYNDFNPLSEIAIQDDKIRNLEAKVKPAPAKKDEDTKTDPPVPNDEEIPAWLKPFLESQKTIAEKLTALEGKSQQETIKTKIATQLKDAPKIIWEKRALPGSRIGDYEAAIAETDENRGVDILNNMFAYGNNLFSYN